MKTGRLIIALVGMLLMGVLAFWGMGALWSYRGAQRIGPEGWAGFGNVGSVRALQLGLAQDLEVARRALRNGDRAGVVRALDGARRVGRVGRSAAEPLFARPLASIEGARRALQNHNTLEASRAVDEAVAALAAESPTGPGALTPSAPADARAYRDAVVLNAAGDRIGRVAGVEGEDVVIVLGGIQDLFGFIDLGGTKVSVPPGDLVFGERRTLGPTMVALIR